MQRVARMSQRGRAQGAPPMATCGCIPGYRGAPCPAASTAQWNGAPLIRATRCSSDTAHPATPLGRWLVIRVELTAMCKP